MLASRVAAYGLSEGIRIADVQRQSGALHEYRLVSPGVLHSSSGVFGGGQIFVFVFGVVVFWGLSEVGEQQLAGDLWPFLVEPVSRQDAKMDAFHQVFLEDTKDRLIVQGRVLYLRETRKEKELLAVSYALGQSLKLALLEGKVSCALGGEKRKIPLKLAKDGYLGALSRRRILRDLGELYLLRIDLNLLHTCVMRAPDLPEHPSKLYTDMRAHLKVGERAKKLNGKYLVVGNILDTLRTYADASRYNRLVWIVILLLVAAIVVKGMTMWVEVAYLGPGSHSASGR